MEGEGIVDLIEWEGFCDVFSRIDLSTGQQGDSLLNIREVAAMGAHDEGFPVVDEVRVDGCLLYTSPSPRDS